MLHLLRNAWSWLKRQVGYHDLVYLYATPNRVAELLERYPDAVPSELFLRTLSADLREQVEEDLRGLRRQFPSCLFFIRYQ